MNFILVRMILIKMMRGFAKPWEYSKKIFIKTYIFFKNNEGQSLTEYALIIVFVCIVVVGILTIMGTNLRALFQNFLNQAFP